MTQEMDGDVDTLVRQRIRALRLARGWSLDNLAARSFLSPSNLSRIETGGRRIALDQLVPLARALGTTLDQLVGSPNDDDVVIRPERDERRGMTVWTLARERNPHDMTVAKMRITTPAPSLEGLGVHPGRDWFTVLSGTAELRLGDRLILVEAGNAAEFSTMIPHAIGAHGGPVEVLTMMTQDAHRAHLHDD
ncbi:transcriptional regulator, XRE family with cupin sensor [Sanguibacter gelidistatuariae]|uniref:Transcriptional regulator, XRE family with cupin sensor n=1 Tax=Sanguibacter gelidistatuariae TaxID=1814289 RepID=A0A1G6HF18_9MICO|nr:XRE family transcriptional regulator [Sanguibacter gelidistatuariae]SDB92917.1 transcriptional regulator, XRE family with cupin sensor [Sanguibacter gelidistatuariae]